MASSIINSDDGSVSGTTGLKTTGGDDGALEIQSVGTKYMTVAAGGDISFYEATGTTAKFFWDASAESLGIGTSSPSELLDVYGAINVRSGFNVQWGSGDNYIAANSSVMLFGVNAAERMRIDSSGRLMFNRTTTTGARVCIQETAAEAAIDINHTNSGTQYFQYMRYNGTAIGTIIGSNTSTSYNTTSDYRLKEDWQPMSGSIDRLKALNPVNFAWKADGSRVDGFLAHEAAEVVPEAVSGEKDAMRNEEYEVTPAVLDDDGNVVTEAVMGTREVPDYQGIDQSKLVPLLTAALQEAVAKIEALETRIAALEG